VHAPQGGGRAGVGGRDRMCMGMRVGRGSRHSTPGRPLPGAGMWVGTCGPRDSADGRADPRCRCPGEAAQGAAQGAEDCGCSTTAAGAHLGRQQGGHGGGSRTGACAPGGAEGAADWGGQINTGGEPTGPTAVQLPSHLGAGTWGVVGVGVSGGGARTPWPALLAFGGRGTHNTATARHSYVLLQSVRLAIGNRDTAFLSVCRLFAESLGPALVNCFLHTHTGPRRRALPFAESLGHLPVCSLVSCFLHTHECVLPSSFHAYKNTSVVFVIMGPTGCKLL
jgi:hypothetical protein